MAYKTPRSSITGFKSGIAQLANKYKFLSRPDVVNTCLRTFVMYESLKLVNRLNHDSRFPKDTGLLKSSWVVPGEFIYPYDSISNDIEQDRLETEGCLTTLGRGLFAGYVLQGNDMIPRVQPSSSYSSFSGSYASGTYAIYALNTATIGQREDIIYARHGWTYGSRKKKHGNRSYRLKRYFKYVKRAQTRYSNALNTVRQTLSHDFKLHFHGFMNAAIPLYGGTS